MSTAFATFIVRDLLFGVDVQRVQEVIRHQAMTPIPTASPVVRGLINLRGQIVTALDLRVRLALGDHESDVPRTNVVVRTDEGAVALLVDEVGDVLTVDPAAWEPTPATLAPAVRHLIPGAFKLEGRLMLQLDVDRVLDCDAAIA